MPFEPFLMTVLNARFRIWILDAHFEGPEGYAVLRHALDLRLEDARQRREAFDVRIMTGRLKELRTWLAAERVPAVNVQFKGRSDGFHDRYALVDNDLWHFGSTVGGGHNGLSCASRGWSAHVVDFERLFASWWG